MNPETIAAARILVREVITRNSDHYTGMQVDALIDAAERLEAKYARLCKNCDRNYGNHGHEFDACNFVEVSCEACLAQSSADIGYQCRKRCIPGTRFCMEHQAR